MTYTFLGTRVIEMNVRELLRMVGRNVKVNVIVGRLHDAFTQAQFRIQECSLVAHIT